jgi:dTDP-4-amino-4,6-dideoxygalactose transaminase
MMILHSRPWVGEEDVRAVAATLRSGHLSAGEQVRRFEAELARTVGQREGVATSSGTAALHLALLALGVGEGDEVVLPSYVCTAVLNAVHHARAAPVLCDVDDETGNLDPADARRRFTKRTKAVIVVHLFGHPAELGWAQEIGMPVIEDCAQALGARWQGRAVGSFGHISVFSFYATKVISTGEGGMACSSSPELADRMRALRDYDNREDYEVRYNYKMSDVQASLGLAQLARLAEALARRRALANSYDAAVGQVGVSPPPRRRGCEPIFYRYVIRTNRVEQALAEFAARSVQCKRPVFRPLHHYLNGASAELPRTESIYAQALSVPLYPALSNEQANHVMEAARAVLGSERKRRQIARQNNGAT